MLPPVRLWGELPVWSRVMTSPVISELPSHATGAIIIDLARIRANWRALADRVRPAECAAVVKADAYGLGAAHVIPALAREGARTLFVATPDEAAEARGCSPGTTIYVLDGLWAADFLIGIDARPVLSTYAQIEQWAAASARAGRRLAAAIQLESGLNRLGLDAAEARRLADDAGLMGRIDVALVMSHLACADDTAHAKNAEQRARFDAARRGFPGAKASLSASDGLMLDPAYHYDLARPGYALYGGQALPDAAAPVLPAVEVHARILQVRDVAAGESVGYSATWTARAPRRIATIAAGYADGISRHASATNDREGGIVAVRGKLCPIVGRVSMDLITVDVTGCADAVPGAFAELIGPNITLEEAGRRAGTIGYEVLTRLGRRFHRVYLGGED